MKKEFDYLTQEETKRLFAALPTYQMPTVGNCPPLEAAGTTTTTAPVEQGKETTA